MRPLRKHRRTLLRALLAAALTLVMECVVFNLPFWTTLAASTDSDGASNAMGPGVVRTADGLLKVVDPTQAYLEFEADGSSSFARLDPLPMPHGPRAKDAPGTLSTVRVRLDSDGNAGRSQSVDLRAPRSLYLHADAGATIRLWLQEPAGSLIAIRAARANVRVPFRFDWLRVAVMASIMLIIAALRPRSALWRITLDPASARQRLAFAVPLLLMVALAAAGIIGQLRTAAPLAFHVPGEYTYDFDQYGHMADALLHGRTWLDLPVPEQLAAADNPYDTATREQLLARGVSPIYWDYAFHQGHWFSYFGVLPAIALFAPYRMISALWTPGGEMLPASAAVLLLVTGFVVVGSLLIVRLVRRLAPHASLGATSMALLLFLIGSNVAYLGLRRNFYSVPFAASLLLSALGLWFWIAASGPRHDGRGMWRIGDAPAISLPHLAAGSLCIAANVGCRPTFALVALLGFPLFRRQIAAVLRAARPGATPAIGALRAACAVLVPALCMVVPIGAYNAARFGSPFDFGDSYQLTVTDMTRYAPSSSNILTIAGYYLALPLRVTSGFPFLALSPTPLAQWAYTEPLVGGLFVLCPALLLAWALPFLRRRLYASGLWGTMMVCLSLAMALILVDAARGGLGWRYMTDFGWLFSLGAIAVMLVMLRETDSPPSTKRELSTGPDTRSSGLRRLTSRHESWRGGERRGSHGTGSCRLFSALWFMRIMMLALMLASLVTTALSFFVPGRDDALIHTAPALYYGVRSWFM